MPHATMPSPGFQAIILCGPGLSLNTFTSNPQEFPKALVPIANRPMVWYPLDWCYRMGITNITLVTPPESEAALKAALGQNPHLTSLPSPTPDVLAPSDLTQTTGTGEIFRLAEVREAVVGDFIVLPCDLVCELEGTSLLELWMVQQSGLGGATSGRFVRGNLPTSTGEQQTDQKGGLGVWYSTKAADLIKKEETDFIMTTPLPAPLVQPPTASLRSNTVRLVYSAPTDTVNDISEEKKSFPIRHGLLNKFGRVKVNTAYRDAHIYIFPYWVLEMMQNERLETIGEDVVGWWAKAGWQEGLADKLGLRDILIKPRQRRTAETNGFDPLADDVDIHTLRTTRTIPTPNKGLSTSTQLASRVMESSMSSSFTSDAAQPDLIVPPMLAYVQPQPPPVPEGQELASYPIIRRVDTSALLMTLSLRLARIGPTSGASAGTKSSPFAHEHKISPQTTIPVQCRVEAENTLVAENVTIEEKCNIKESVIGPNCKIGSGARLLKCVLMEGAVVGENCQLSGCILGRRCRIEGGPRQDEDKTNLKDCEVQEGNIVPWGTDAKGEKFMVFETHGDDDDFDNDADEDDAQDDIERQAVSER